MVKYKEYKKIGHPEVFEKIEQDKRIPSLVQSYRKKKRADTYAFLAEIILEHVDFINIERGFYYYDPKEDAFVDHAKVSIMQTCSAIMPQISWRGLDKVVDIIKKAPTKPLIIAKMEELKKKTQPILTDKVKDEILSFIKWKNNSTGITFLELQKLIPEFFKGNKVLNAVKNPKVLFWTGLDTQLIGFLSEAQIKGTINLRESSMFEYLICGGGLSLPIVKRQSHIYKTYHWLPSAIVYNGKVSKKEHRELCKRFESYRPKELT